MQRYSVTVSKRPGALPDDAHGANITPYTSQLFNGRAELEGYSKTKSQP